MSLGSIVTVLLVLLVVFLFSRMWFHFVEGILGFLKRLFGRKKEPPAWHPLLKDEEENNISK